MSGMNQSTGQGFSPQPQRSEELASSPETTSSGPCQPPPRKRLEGESLRTSACTIPVPNSEGEQMPLGGHPTGKPENGPQAQTPVESSSSSSQHSETRSEANRRLRDSGRAACSGIGITSGGSSIPDYATVPSEEDPVAEFGRASAALLNPAGYDEVEPPPTIPAVSIQTPEASE